MKKKVVKITDARPRRRPFLPGALLVWLATALALVVEIGSHKLPAWATVMAVAWGFVLAGSLIVWVLGTGWAEVAVTGILLIAGIAVAPARSAVNRRRGRRRIRLSGSRGNDMKFQLTCVDCGTESRPAVKAADARALADSDGWQVGMRGTGMNRIEGWENDFCPNCKVNHPRTYCDGIRRVKCQHRAIYVITRTGSKPVVTARTCGKHLGTILREMVLSGKSATVEEAPL